MHTRGILEDGIYGAIKNDDVFNSTVFDDQRTHVDNVKSRNKSRFPNCI